MYFLQRSAWYDLEYSFCQTDTFPDLNTAVSAEHGVCSICSINWLLSKIANQPFTFSNRAIFDNRQLYTNKNPNFGAVYFAALIKDRRFRANQRGPETAVTLNYSGGEGIATTLRTHAGALIHVGQGLSRRTAGSAHVLAVYRRSGKYYMFDPNFGSYTCSYERGVANWFNNIVTRNRPPVGTQPAKGKYSDWAAGADVLSYPV